MIDDAFFDDVDAKKLSYQVISLSIYDKNALELLNQAYSLWKKMWFSVFEKTDSLESMKPENLLRQNYLALLQHEEKILGFNYFSKFDLKNELHCDSEYYQYFQDELKKISYFYEMESVYSLEYLTGGPNWKKLYPNISLGELLIRLGGYFAKSQGAHLLLGSTRSDINVTGTAVKAGVSVTGKSILKCNYECDLVYLPVVYPNPEKNADLNRAASDLYQNFQHSSENKYPQLPIGAIA